MNRVVITIRPAFSDDALLSVSDAMLQVLDSLRLLQNAQLTMGDPHDRFDWKLERAFTSGSFTIVAVALPMNPSIDISGAVERTKAHVSRGIKSLIVDGVTAPWMTQESLSIVRSIFARNQNGIGETTIDFGGAEILSIDRQQAEAGSRAVAHITR